MKSKLMFGSLALLSAGAIAWAAKDPVVMTVNNEDVPKSEFEYLYHKNSQQQIEAQPLDEYIGMFELYKMKVADAKAEGIDTTAAFLSEMAQYRRDLAEPYLADSVYLNNLVAEVYDDMQQELDYYHIMFPKGRNTKENKESLQRADSVHKALLNGADFEQMARQFSSDRSVPVNGGHLGYIAAGTLLPYSFEHAAYALSPGEISDVVETNAGYHIIKVGNRRPARGAVRAAHIMKMVRPGMPPEAEEAAKNAIDSIYALLLVNPDAFEQIAQANSDDGSARMGGQLGWFAAGKMVPEFSDVAFELPVGGISKPVRTNFGWHIIKKMDAKGVRSLEEIKPELLAQFNDQRDDRYKLIRANRDKNLESKHKGSINNNSLQKMRDYISANGMDSLFYATFASNDDVLFTVEGKPTTVGNFVVATLSESIIPDAYVGGRVFEEKFATAYDNALINAEEDWLYANNEDYRNLLNEYRDGSLLYEVSLRKVWDKAANDTKGLESYFKANRDKYKFKEPRAKGFLVLAKNDSIGDLIKTRFTEIDKDSALQILRNEFRQEAVIDKLLAPKGINRFVDKIVFNGDDPEINPKFPVYFILDARVVSEPEEMSDVKGMVTSDYQQLLEQNWTTELRKKYPVKRNNKVLKTIK